MGFSQTPPMYAARATWKSAKEKTKISHIYKYWGFLNPNLPQQSHLVSSLISKTIYIFLSLRILKNPIIIIIIIMEGSNKCGFLGYLFLLLVLLPVMCYSQDNFVYSRATYYGSPDCYGTPCMPISFLFSFYIFLLLSLFKLQI